MTWLFPLYLLGGAAILGPILMHLRRRPPQDRVEFSSLMFLEAQTPMPVSRRRVEDWLLLLLRCLALLLLALMFARPLWRAQSEAAVVPNKATILLLDRSASMQRGDLWKQAIAAATQHLEQSAMTDRIAVATFDRELEWLWSFDQDKVSASTRGAVLKPKLRELKPGWAATHLGQALVQAGNELAIASGLNAWTKKVVLISDFQEGASLEALRGMIWPESMAVQVVRLETPTADNFTLSLAAKVDEEQTRGLLQNERGASFHRVRVSNSRDSQASDFQLAWESGSKASTPGYVPPGASRVLSVTGTAGTLRLSGDAWDFDNRLYIAPVQPKVVKIVFIGDEKTRDEAASPLYYLSRALQPSSTLRPELTVVSATAGQWPVDAEWVFISGARPSAALEKSLRAWMERGGFVVSVISDGTSAQDLEALTGLSASAWKLGPSVSSHSMEDYRMLADVQTAHPLLRTFDDERLRDFTKLRFWKHRPLALAKDASSMEVLARFDQGDPAILAGKVGKGRVILLASGWHPADSQLALSTKFVPLLFGWFGAAGLEQKSSTSLTVGDVIHAESATSLMTPEGQTLRLKPGGTIRAELPGIYSVGKDRLIAVNVAAEEGRIAPMDLAKLRELGVPVGEGEPQGKPSARVEDKQRLAITEQEARQRAWLWLLGALLVILAWETWLAGRIRPSQPQPTFSVT